VLTLRCLTAVVLLFLLPRPALGRFITSAEEFSLSAKDVNFTWAQAKTRSLKILLEYRDTANAWRRVSLGSGFLLSSDGLFEADSTNGKETHTPDEIIKQRDFVVGKLKTDATKSFSFWRLKDFDQTVIDVSNPGADFQLTPLMPPKKVFIAGFPNGSDLVISEGFLNLTEKNRRGYFAADLKVYTKPYLESQGVAVDTKWGMRVENHMSGGAVVDSSGFVVGLVVSGNHNTAGILSIENILSTFFSRAGSFGVRPALLLKPTDTPLYLKQQAQ
jgi:hypothetical protein